MTTRRPTVQLFCEDVGHEEVVRAVVRRIERDEEVRVDFRTASSRGGHARAMGELETFQRLLTKGRTVGVPDLLVVAIDANCQGWDLARKEIRQRIDDGVIPAFVIACPDPHVERWCFADPIAYRHVVGIDPPADAGKCERHRYKELLKDSLHKAAIPILIDPMEIARDLIGAMDLHRAGKRQPSFGAFVTELRGWIRRQKRDAS